MDILSRGHNFSELMEQNEVTVYNHRSNAEFGQINHIGSGSGSSLNWQRLADTLIVSKRRPGFDRDAVRSLTALLEAITSGEVAGLKYLVFNFCHESGNGAVEQAAGFEALVAANAELILSAPVISIAWVPSDMRGADLEFAMSCSSIAALGDARFYFDESSTDSFGLYNALSRKIGFVKAERLFENERALNAREMDELLLAKHISDVDEGLSGIETYVGRLTRRYNASYGIFRAQRMSLGTWDMGSAATSLRVAA
jgi:enoyl-CoA hydratase/carnithine racemase